MPEETPPDVRHCLRRAFESRCFAHAAKSPALREHWLGMERRWLLLADSHGCAEHTAVFMASLRLSDPPRRYRAAARAIVAHEDAAHARASASGRLKRPRP